MIMQNFYCAPYGHEDRLRQQLRDAENEVRRWQEYATRVRAELAEIAKLNAS